MHKKAKRYLFTTQTREVIVIRNGRQRMRAFCDECGREVEILNFDEVLSLLHESEREIVAAIQKGEIHSLETGGGHLLVCRDSLKNEGNISDT